MQKRAFLQNKLWRDKAVALMEEMHSVIHWHRLDDTEYDHQLRQKLLEESKEVCAASSKEALVQELADLLEVIEAIARSHNVSLEEIREIQLKKKAERGGFDERKFVAVAEHLEGSLGERYCLADPEKHPEINDSWNETSN